MRRQPLQTMKLHILDYLIFGGMILGSTLIGIYYGWYKKSKSINEYVRGDQLLYPVVVSVVITVITPQQMLSDPAEVVMYGTQFGFALMLGQLIGCVIFIVLFLPVQMALTERSLLEYFERRHSKTVRIVAASISMLRKITMMPILIYMPALVMEKTFGVATVYTSVTIVCVCLFYTCMGGLSAVIWTDTLQCVYYAIAVFVCLSLGVYEIGGLGQVIRDGIEGERIEFFNFGDYLFYDRVNLFAIFSGTLHSVSMCLTNQSFYQRIDCIRNKNSPLKMVILSFIGFALSQFCGSLTGLIMYSYFKDCNPLLTKEIKKADQIVPFFIEKMAETIPGLLGLFLAGVVSASLSTISTTLNTFSCSIHDDIIVKMMKSQPNTQKTSLLIIKTTAILMGLVGLASTTLMESINSMQKTVVTVAAMTGGANFGVFIACMTNPWVTSKGLVAGAIAGLAVPTSIFFSQRALVSQGKLIYYTKFISASGCNSSHFGDNITSLTTGFRGLGTKTFIDLDAPLTWITGLSFQWFGIAGAITCILVSGLVSICTGAHDPAKVDPVLIIPQLRWLLPKPLKKDAADQKEYEPIPLQ